MKLLTYIIAFTCILSILGCDSGNESKEKELPKVSITSPSEGYIYLNGIYTGYKTPKDMFVSPGNHVIGVAMDHTKTYLRREVEIGTENIRIDLENSDKPEPKLWKGLWVGIREATLDGKSTTYTEEELDKGYAYFQWSIKEHFEDYSYNTIKWEISRKDIVDPVTVDVMESGDHTITPSSMGRLLPEIQPGVYDNVFSFFKERDEDCVFKGGYFALAWLDPFDSDIETGYVTVKFDATEPIETHLSAYKAEDPGVYCHEWLHTVGEYFFQSKGVKMPKKAPANNLMVHAADHVYNYTFPWLTWYQDVMAGRVQSDGKFVGIGPENFLKYTIRETALQTQP